MPATNSNGSGIPISASSQSRRNNNTVLNSEDDFVTGNFSAKYATRQTSSPPASDATSSLISETAEQESQSARLHIIKDGFETPSSSLRVLNSRSSNQRRQSVLSNMLARSGSTSFPNASSEVVSVVNRHLVHDSGSDLGPVKSTDSSKFDSLQLQGGDVTRDLYNWVDGQESRKRANSFSEFGSQLGGDESDVDSSFMEEVSVNDLRIPGGFRRDFMKRQKNVQEGNFLTQNFIEFITIYGHFAGEDIDEEDEDEEGENQPLIGSSRLNSFNSTDNNSILIRQNQIMKRKFENRVKPKTTSNLKSFLLLLKAFLGTGVLFLPKSFSNGGLLYSNLMIIFFSILSYYCFVTLINIRSKLNVSSYGNLGLLLYGPFFKMIILMSIILSQIGFSAAYIVFVATNFQNLIPMEVSLQVLILLQLVFFVPMSLIRKISKLSTVVLISDFFILLGLIYVYYYSIYNVALHGIDWSNITIFVDSEKWSLFIGTLIFTYEGIGLLIPIQESMTTPQSFNKILLIVMILITVIFITIGSISYISFGNAVKTVILLNFENSELIQLIYSVAILLSTPLQLFPGIKMIELISFHEASSRKLDPQHIDRSIDLIKSGKSNPKIKLKKNLLRIIVVILTVLISVVGSSDLDRFVSLIGSFTCIPLIYVFPPLLNLKLFQIDQIKIGDYNLKIKHDDDRSWIKIVDWFVLVLGLGMMSYTSISTLYDWIR